MIIEKRIVELEFPYAAIHPCAESLTEAMGYSAGRVPRPLQTTVESVLEEAEGYCDTIAAGYCTIPSLRIESDTIEIPDSGVRFDCGTVIARQLQGCSAGVLFCATAGERIERIARELMQNGDTVKGYVFDTLGSELAERAADRLSDTFAESIAPKSLGVSNRFSPGYCGWPVAQQHTLFSFFPDTFCGITLSETALMHPIKSVSGIIGIGKNVRKLPYSCALCTMEHCYKRKKPPKKRK
jgi:hypothetical protein